MASKDIISYPSLPGNNVSSELPHDWQNDLMKGTVKFAALQRI
jgi:hypothetical protein